MKDERPIRKRMDESQSKEILNKQKDLKGKICKKPFNAFEVHIDGSVSVCCPSWLPKRVGNLNDNTVEEVFNSKGAQEIRESMLDGSFKFCNHKICPVIQSLNPDVLMDKGSEEERYKKTKGLQPKMYNLCYDESCNLSCPSCRANKILYTEGPVYERKKKIQQKIIDFVFSKENKENCRMNITGSGDPFGSKLFRELLFSVDGREFPNVTIDLQTNGVMFTPRYWDKIKKIHNNLGSVYLSLDAAKEETYNITRRGGDWKRVIENIKFLSTKRREKKFKWFRLDFVVQNVNFKEMPDFVELGKQLGVDQVYFSLVIDWGTWPKEEYERQCVWKKSHHNFEDFLNMLKRPEFDDWPYVDLGNLSEYVNRAKSL